MSEARNAKPDHVWERVSWLLGRCEALNLVIPDDMPLDTPEHQRAAAIYLSRLVELAERGDTRALAMWGVLP